MRDHLYYIYGISISFSTDSLALASAVQMLICHFQRETLAEPIALEFVFREVGDKTEIPIAVSPSARVISSISGTFDGDSLGSEWKCDLHRMMAVKIANLHDRGIMLIDSQGNRVEGYLVKPDIRYPEILARFFYIALVELLKGKGLYGIHAAALEKEGIGLLIPGPSGSGKTTCSISLLRAGYRYVSDDHTLLRENDGVFEGLLFPLRLDNRLALDSFFKEVHDKTGVATLNATDKTIEFFPELSAAQGYPYREPSKRYFFVEDLYPDAPIQSCQLNFIIFPKIIDYPKSYLEPLPKSRALEKLLPQGFIVFDKDIGRKHFQTLARLVEKTDCYQLYCGEDVRELPQLIDSLLATV